MGHDSSMIATCPQCDARYRVKDDKIPDRGARITCPKCAHRFVVYRDTSQAVVGAAPEPAGVPVTFARKGQITRNAVPVDEDESDAPTTVMPHGSSLAREIRAAIQAQQEAERHAAAGGSPAAPPATPAPAPSTPTADLRRAAKAPAQPAEARGGLTAVHLFIGLAVVAAILVGVASALSM